jgi:uncharacterized membrane protein
MQPTIAEEGGITTRSGNVLEGNVLTASEKYKLSDPERTRLQQRWYDAKRSKTKSKEEIDKIEQEYRNYVSQNPSEAKKGRPKK